MKKPSDLLVCVKDGGKPQMAAGLTRKLAGDSVEVHSPATKPGIAINSLSAQTLPKPIDPRLVRDVDVVVTLGREANVRSKATP